MALGRQETLEMEAAEWAVALDRGLTDAEQATLDIWLAKDPRRQGALVRARVVWLAAAGAGQHEARPPRPSLNRRAIMTGAIAAGVAGVVGISAYLGRDGAVRTRRGEVRRLSMADGSEAVINAQTRLRLKFSPEVRRIDMNGGEAWFDVAKDKARPFVVSTDTVQVVAVGTAFSVREADGLTEIVVSEGTVRVEPLGGASPVLLTEGEILRLDAANQMRKAPVDHARVRRRLAWREGLIMLDGETLADAAAEFNQFGARRIIVDPDIAETRVAGIFRIGDAEGFAKANAELLSLDIRTVAEDLHLSRKSIVTENSQ